MSHNTTTPPPSITQKFIMDQPVPPSSRSASRFLILRSSITDVLLALMVFGTIFLGVLIIMIIFALLIRAFSKIRQNNQTSTTRALERSDQPAAAPLPRGEIDLYIYSLFTC